MHRIPIEPPGEDKNIIIGKEYARYLSVVLRLAKGGLIELFDPSGFVHRAEILELSPDGAKAAIISSLKSSAESNLDIVLVQGLLKGHKMDLVIQKAVELGVKRIVPAITERTIVRQSSKTERWRAIATESVRQSGRTSIPVIEPPCGLKECLGAMGEGLNGIVFWEKAGRSMKTAINEIDANKPVILVVGAEGGLSEDEVSFCFERGLQTVNFGARIMRAETASIVAVAVLQSFLGDMV